MPSLEFNGKPFVYAHHLGVPFRTLVPVPEKSVFPKGKGGKNGAALEGANLLIHGDNLHALKALMPCYAGRVDCVCIDPPYNTGKEGWVYNDNVNSPLMRRWLQENGAVDMEDMERHDKWMCMMWPRLKLLRELLAEDGVIFIFIDDNEQHRLRMMMDEIFGEDNFIANIVVRTNPGGRDYGGIARTHDYVLVYGNGEGASLGMLAVNGDELPMLDGIGGFELRELRNRNRRFNAANRPNLHYPFHVNPKGADENGLHEVSLTPKKGWVEVYPLESAGVKTVWRWGKEKVQKRINVDVKAKPRRDDGFQIVEKFRRNGTRERSIMDHTDYRNERGTLTVKSLLGNSGNFDYPKSEAVVKRLLALGTREDSIVLDSFAGSGTTAHAVLALNNEDGGDRQFILVECEDYADKITAERVRRVIKGVPKARDEALRKGFGGNFVFSELGVSVDEETMFSGKLPDYETLARYAAYTATGVTLEKIRKGRDGFFGEAGEHRFHMIYEPDEDFLVSDKAILKRDASERIGAAAKAKNKRALVFAVMKHMSQKALTPMGVVYCQLPYAIYRIFGGIGDA